MQIKSFHVVNFKGIKDFTFYPGHLNLFTGPNGSGKTSLLQAIEYALTGSLPPNYTLIGESVMSVSMEIQDIGTFTRSIEDGKTVIKRNNRKSTIKKLNETLSKLSNVSLDDAKILSGFSGGMKSVTSLLLGNSLNKIVVEKKDLLGKCDFSDAAIKEIDMHLNDEVTLSDIQALHGYAVGHLKVLKKKQALIKKLKQPIETTESLDALNKQITSLESELSVCQEKELSFKGIISYCEMLEKALNEFKYNEAYQDIKDIDSLIEKLFHMKDSIGTISQTMAVVKCNGAYNRALANQEPCPLCGSDPTKKSAICAKNKVGQLLTQYQTQNDQVEDLNKQCISLQRLLPTALQQFISNKMREAFIGELNQIYPSHDDNAKNTSRQNELCEELNKLYEKRKLLSETTLKTNDNLPADREKIEQDLCSYSEIKLSLSPDSIIYQSIVQDAIDPIQRFLNEKLAAAQSKFLVRLEYIKKLEMYFVTEKGHIPAFENGSSGQQSQLILMLKDVLNELTSYGILLFDQTDSMDQHNLSTSIGMFSGSTKYDHIFMTAIDVPENIPAEVNVIYMDDMAQQMLPLAA